MEQFLIDQATKKDIVLDSDKSRIADSETNQVVAESKKFTNWHKKQPAGRIKGSPPSYTRKT